ncbi:BglG family transcription antiterminator [Caviibacter abscessus]|uniref:BglG family transcription antiterminator n=1 Tax=Caviibacter abscessus TaxID=1766719 RepID=UPI0008320056|nr:PRD domain-containing protein [Caviibacter abscessus]
MYIDKALYDLINLLLISQKEQTVTELAKKIGKSRRIVYYNLEKINIELSKLNIEIIVNDKKNGIVINNKQSEILRNLILDKEYILSKLERELAITLLIATNPKKQTLDFLVNTFMVSKNSILSDINYIKSKLKKFNNKIKISSANKGGYRIVGPELIQIQYIYTILKKISELKNYKYFDFIQNLYKNTSIVFSDEFIESLINEFYILQEKLGKKVSVKETEHFIFSFPYLYLFAVRIKNKDIEKELMVLKERLEYKILKDTLYTFSRDFNLEYNDKIIMLFTLIVLCTGKITDSHNDSKDYEKLREIANMLISNFENETKFKINDKIQISNDLVTYLKVMGFRRKYNIISQDINVDKVKKEYKSVFDIVKKISKTNNLDFNDDDISIISLNLARVVNIVKKINILIITNEGNIIKKLLVSNLEKLFSNIQIIDIIDKSKFSKYNTDNIDLIISTEDDIKYKNGVVYVDYLLSNENLIDIFTNILKITENIL